MSDFQCFFELQTPKDLLKKLEHDLGRLKQDRMNQFAAFDFFVTAHHLQDWIHPDSGGKQNRSMREDLENRVPLLQVCAHIANGAKHFQATAKHHVAVEKSSLQQGAFDSSAFQMNAFDTDRLVIELNRDIAEQLSFHDYQVECLALAEKVLDFWKQHLG